MDILVQMLSFRDKTQKLRAIIYWTHHRILLTLLHRGNGQKTKVQNIDFVLGGFVSN